MVVVVVAVVDTGKVVGEDTPEDGDEAGSSVPDVLHAVTIASSPTASTVVKRFTHELSAGSGQGLRRGVSPGGDRSGRGSH